MKKIPTLFERVYADHQVVGITDKVTPGMEWVLDGEGDATIKVDGSCCAIINGVFYKRFDAKSGKKAPDGAIPCCDPDPITGHHPHWLKVDANNPGDKWFAQMLPIIPELPDGTYEAIGKHFQGNPYGLDKDILYRHGSEVVTDVDRSFDGIMEWLKRNSEEGLVFWKDGEPRCKIKRTDFGLAWGNSKERPVEIVRFGNETD